jgi:ribosomal protein S18 acetylase RimI-like enzyme
MKEVIEEARPRDLTRIIVLEDRCFGEYGYPARLLLALMTLYPGFFLVYRLGGETRGYVSGVKRRGSICHIMSLCVDPSVRRRGIGRRLVEEVEKRFAAHGCLVSRLEVGFTNIPALRLYAGMGYKPAFFKPSYYPGGGAALVMYKPLHTLGKRDKL